MIVLFIKNNLLNTIWNKSLNTGEVTKLIEDKTEESSKFSLRYARKATYRERYNSIGMKWLWKL